MDAPLYSRPAPLQFGSTRQVLDVSRSGARIYSDEFHAEGSQLELELFLAVKLAFDPQGLLNPGKAVPTLARCAEFGRGRVHRGALPHPGLPRF